MHSSCCDTQAKRNVQSVRSFLLYNENRTKAEWFKRGLPMNEKGGNVVIRLPLSGELDFCLWAKRLRGSKRPLPKGERATQ